MIFEDLGNMVFRAVIVASFANNEADIKKNGKYFFPRANIEHYNALIGGRNFYDQPINDLIK